MQKSLNLKFLKIIFFFVVLYLIITLTDWESFLSALSSLSFFYLFLSVVLEWGIYFLESLRLNRVSGQMFSVGVLWRSRLSSVFMGNFLPGLAASEVLRTALMVKGDKQKITPATLLVLSNRIYGLLGLLLLFIVSFCIFSHDESIQIPSYYIFLMSVFILLVPLFSRIKFLRKLFLIGIRKMKWKKPRKQIFLGYQSILLFFSGRNYLWGLLLSFISNAIIIARIYLVAKNLVPLSFLDWCIYFPLISILTFLPLGYGAIGTQEMGFLWLANRFGLESAPFILISSIIHIIRFLGGSIGILYYREYKDVIQLIKKKNVNEK